MLKRRLSFVFALVAIISLVSAPATRAAGLLIADGGSGGVLEIKEHAVHVTINNGIAVTDVTQVFQNTEDRQVEALYTFPVPRGASVANFSMWINGKEMVGEVLEKKRAREIYDSYKQQRQRSRACSSRPTTARSRCASSRSAPRAEQKVQITYYQELDFDHDWATYVYPLATQTRPGVNSRTTGKFALTLDVKSEIPIADMESPSHPERLRHRQAQRGVLAGEPGNHAAAIWAATSCCLSHRRARSTGIDVITSKRGERGRLLRLTLTAGEELAAQNDRAWTTCSCSTSPAA